MTSALINGRPTYVHRIQRFPNSSGMSTKPLHVQFREALKSAFERGAAQKPRNAPKEAICKCGEVYAAYADRTACYFCTKYSEMPLMREFLGKGVCVGCGAEFSLSKKSDRYCFRRACTAKRHEEWVKKKQEKANERSNQSRPLQMAPIRSGMCADLAGVPEQPGAGDSVHLAGREEV